MKKLLCILFISLLYPEDFEVSAQTIEAKNSIYIEFFGNAGLFYNFTYDRILIQKGKGKLSSALGIQYLPEIDFISDKIYSFSPQIGYFWGVKHHFETSLGGVFPLSENNMAVMLRIGYRYQNPVGGLFFKTGFTPMYLQDLLGEPAFLPWGGVGVGVSF